MGTDFRGVPGSYDGPQITHRNIFVQNGRDVSYNPSSANIDGSLSRDAGNDPTSLLRAGLLMGKNAANRYRPSVIGLTTVAAANGAVAVTVSVAAAVEIARLKAVGGGGNLALKLIGPPAAAGVVAVLALVVTAVNTGTGVLTVTAIGAAAAAGSIVAPDDGNAHLPVAPLTQPFGIDVADTAGNSVNQPMLPFLRGADLLAKQIVNLTEGDASVQAWIKAQLKAAGYFTFDNDR